MIRVLFYLAVIAALAYGADWLLQHPGHVEIAFDGYDVTMSPAVGLALFLVAVAAAVVLWAAVRLVVGLPSFLALSARQRRREKGYAALSRGLIAAGAGDAPTAQRASAQASRHLRDDPLAMLLRATAARLADDRPRAEASFGWLARRADTRLLGLRGLHEEAVRRGDGEAAIHFAAEARRVAPLPWAAQAVLDRHAADGAWEKALADAEAAARSGHIDRAASDRQRAVLETALALEKQDTAPDEALRLARLAIKRAPTLVPAVALAARLLARRGDIRKATRLIETAWPRTPHPDLARAYLDVRPGDSTGDRLGRAQALMRIASVDPVSRLTVARAALAARQFAAAREAMAPLVAEGARPTVRACLAMADIEDAEFGDKGQWREWLGRASRAPLDPAWVDDGVVYDRWEPVSPTTGRLDAFAWQVPAERPAHAIEAMPAPVSPRAALAPLARHGVETAKDHAAPAVVPASGKDAPGVPKPSPATASAPLVAPDDPGVEAVEEAPAMPAPTAP